MSMATQASERPILFSAPMVRAILDGRKTMTRRVVKRVVPSDYSCTGHVILLRRDRSIETDERALPFCPFGQPGSRLWVRESFCDRADYAPIAKLRPDRIHYAADGKKAGWLYRPSIHMPRWASRITLEITAVRVERLQAITEEDAKAEGIESWQQGYPRSTGEPFVGYETLYGFGEDVGWVPTASPTAILAFQRLWESIHGVGSWAANPFVWCIEFMRAT